MSYSSYENISAKELNNKAALILLEKGIMQGDNGDLALEQSVKREEMIVLISRLLKQEDTARNYSTDKLKFEDVDKNNWAAPYIAWAYDKGITKGYNETSFGYGEYITYDQGLAFLIRILGYDVTDDMWLQYNGVNERAFELGLTRNYIKTQCEYIDVEYYISAYPHTGKKLSRDILAIYTYDALLTDTTNNRKLGVELGIFTKQEVDNILINYNKSNIEYIQSAMRNMKERIIYIYMSTKKYPDIDEIYNSDTSYSGCGIKVFVEKVNAHTYKIKNFTFGVTEDDVPSILLDLDAPISDIDIGWYRRSYINNTQLAQWQLQRIAEEIKRNSGQDPKVSEIIDEFGKEVYVKSKVVITKLTNSKYKVVNINPDFSIKEIPDYIFTLEFVYRR